MVKEVLLNSVDSLSRVNVISQT